MQKIEYKDFEPYALLPYIKFKEPILLGPVLFSPISAIKDKELNKRLENFGCQKATCISLHLQLPKTQLDSILIDALSLVYFSLIYKDLYNDNQLPHLYPFTKVVILDPQMNDANVCVSFPIEEVDDINREMIQSLGDLLAEIYLTNKPTHELQKIIRAVRFFVDRMHEKIENIVAQGHDKLSFEPEDTVFLAKSFETLFNIDGHQPVYVYKQQLRQLLDLNFSKPVELLWKWIDGFLEYTKLISLNEKTNSYFTENENLKVTYLYIGSKLFIYAVCNKLKLLDSSEIDIQDALLFFWPELGILRKLAFTIIQLEQNVKTATLPTDLHMLSELYIRLFKQYIQNPKNTVDVAFVESQKETLVDYLETILRSGDPFISKELRDIIKHRLSSLS